MSDPQPRRKRVRKKPAKGHNPLPRPGRRLIRYEERFERIAFARALLGDTMEEIAAVIGCRPETILKWRKDIPAFALALKKGKIPADDEVTVALFRRATGYSHPAVKVFLDPDTKRPIYADFTEHYPPDTGACMAWLKNRRPELWRDRHELTGRDGGPIQTEDVTKDAAARAARVVEILGRAKARQEPAG